MMKMDSNKDSSCESKAMLGSQESQPILKSTDSSISQKSKRSHTSHISGHIARHTVGYDLQTSQEYDETSNKEVPSNSKKRFLFFTLAVMSFSAGVMFAMIAPFFPIVSADKGSDAFTTGIVLGVLELAIAIMAPIFGSLLGKTGVQFTYAAGVFFAGSCVILMGFLDRAPNHLFIPMTIIVRFCQGVGCAAYLTSSYSTLVYYFRDNVATVLGLMETVNGVGFMIGPLIGSGLYQIGGYQLPFFSVGTVIIIVGLSISRLLPTQIGYKKASFNMFTLLKIPMITLCCFLHITVAAFLGTLDNTLALRLEEYNLTNILVGLVFVAGPGGYILFTPVWGYICDKMPKHGLKFIIAGFTVAGISMLFMGPAPFLPIESSLPLLIVTLVIMGLSVSTLVVTMSVMFGCTARYGFPERIETYGVVSGLLESCFSAGAFSGPILGGLMYDNVGFGWTMTAAGLIMLFFVLLLLIHEIIYAVKGDDVHKPIYTEQVSVIEDNNDKVNVTVRSVDSDNNKLSNSGDKFQNSLPNMDDRTKMNGSLVKSYGSI